ncbi:sodium-dependent transporter [Aminipila luticellarii]|uniref:Sodium-dependent transporter n=1 Tax=Aminipila luticellarii TaxID=2507160 RepID=A0A410PWG9_9FIRM|nr:sodium-dependent transporter [Aminipila luticellarii]QAT43279.1 sodium-dependent transporter [Aminipila luticellarii]
MSGITIVMLVIYAVVFGGGSIYFVNKSLSKKGQTEAAGLEDNQTEGFGSRMGFILSTIGMAVGVGAMWRFPMMCAKWGGGAFVLAFILICVFIVIPAGWAEISYGRHFRKGTVGCGTDAAGLPGKILGWAMSLVSLGVWSYYPAIMALVILYFFKSFKGLDYAANAEAVFETTNDSRIVIYLLVLAVLLLAAVVGVRGIQNGIEKVCKWMIPSLFVILVILVVRVCMIPGIAEGIEYYVKPDWAQLLNPEMWAQAAGMALFAVGLGPGCLLVYGRFVDKNQDITMDFITVNVVQLFICLLSGFVIIPAVVAFGLDPLMGKGIMFVALPKVFASMPGGAFFMILFFIALFFAGISSSFNQVEIATAGFMDKEGFGMTRKKATIVCFILAAIIAFPCVTNDSFFALFDNLIGNIGYTATAFFLALILAWKVGAKKVREEWYLPSSEIKWGPAVDYLYKYGVVIALGYFTVTSILTLF